MRIDVIGKRTRQYEGQVTYKDLSATDEVFYVIEQFSRRRTCSLATAKAFSPPTVKISCNSFRFRNLQKAIKNTPGYNTPTAWKIWKLHYCHHTLYFHLITHKNTYGPAGSCLIELWNSKFCLNDNLWIFSCNSRWK